LRRFSRFLNGLLRRAFTELPIKNILTLCIAPVLFFALSSVYIIAIGSIQGLPNIAAGITRILISLTGIVTYYINIRMVLDTAKRIQTEKELAALDRINQLKTELMRTISHEMRTPLAVISGFAEITAKTVRKNAGEAEGKIAENLDAIAGEAKRMADMVERMRQLALVKEYVKDRRPVDIGAIIYRIADLYAKVLKRRGTVLKLDIAENLPPVYGSDYELTQVLFNILRNSDTHTEGGLIAITAEVAGSMDEMTHGVDEVSTAITRVQEITEENKENIDALSIEVAKFMVD
jgi:signal transduction histidine kinase